MRKLLTIGVPGIPFVIVVDTLVGEGGGEQHGVTKANLYI